jgi:nucleoside-diphosphate-sugar epimerase
MDEVNFSVPCKKLRVYQDLTLRILITGAKGFVGRVLCQSLKDFDVVQAGRDDWLSSLASINCVIHLAARVHIFKEAAKDPLAEYREVNVKKTLDLARQAASLGVKRFVFVSSVKVNGELTKKDISFRADDIPNPQDPYGVSKLDAEIGLMQLAKKTGMEVVIVRPPLVYGPGVKANFLSMIKILDKGIPLPFGNVRNKRSLVYIDNLVDLLIRLIDHPKAPGQVFLVSDDHDVSTTVLLKSMSFALGKKSLLIPVPVFLLQTIFCLIGKSSLSQRLLGSLRLDITKTKEILDWTPPVSFEDGIKKTAMSFLGK